MNKEINTHCVNWGDGVEVLKTHFLKEFICLFNREKLKGGDSSWLFLKGHVVVSMKGCLPLWLENHSLLGKVFQPSTSILARWQQQRWVCGHHIGNSI